jgi:hypothetical protein
MARVTHPANSSTILVQDVVNPLITDYVSQTDVVAQTVASPINFTNATLTKSGVSLATTSDIIPFKLSPTYVVYKNGATYYAIDEDGATLTSNAEPTLVIRAAVAALTGGRTWRESVALKGAGEWTLGYTGDTDPQISLPAYTGLCGNAYLKLADDMPVAGASNVSSIIRLTGDYCHVDGLTVNGNSAENLTATGAGQGMNFQSRSSHNLFTNCISMNARYNGFEVWGYDLDLVDNWLFNCKTIDDGYNGIGFAHGTRGSGAVSCYAHGTGDLAFNATGENTHGVPTDITFDNCVVDTLDGTLGSSNAHFGCRFESAKRCTWRGGEITGVDIGVLDDGTGYGGHLVDGARIFPNNVANAYGVQFQKDNCSVVNCHIEMGATSNYGIAIRFDGKYERAINNYCKAPFATGYGIDEENTAESNTFALNDVVDCTNKILAQGIKTRIFSNRGYNPFGLITNPYTSNTGYINDSAANQAFPATTVVYTVSHSPKLITIYGGTVSEIKVDGVVTGLTTGAFSLQPGQTFKVTHSSNPSSAVIAQ